MSNFNLTIDEIKKLEQLPVVARATQRQITFTQEFKRHALNEFAAGKLRRDIIEAAGICTKNIHNKSIKDMFQRWGRQDLSSEPKPKGRPKTVAKPTNSMDMTIEQLRVKCALQEAEIEFLKKVHALD